MTPQLYLECNDNLDVAQLEQYVGRCWAVDIGSEYPVPPDPPAPHTPANMTWFYSRCLPKVGAGAGGVLVLDDEIVRFCTGKTMTLSDETEYTVDFDTDAKVAGELTAAGQAAVAPPVPPGG